MRYDADQAPDPEIWLELDESERVELVMAYHHRNGLSVGQCSKSPARERWAFVR
jgi:hypothetical protein